MHFQIQRRWNQVYDYLLIFSFFWLDGDENYLWAETSKRVDVNYETSKNFPGSKQNWTTPQSL